MWRENPNSSLAQHIFMTHSNAAPNPTPDIESARRNFTTFLDDVPKTSRLVALHDTDADGVTSGVLWQRACERLGFENVSRVVPDRERNAWTSENRERARQSRPEHLFVMDLGSQPVAVVDGIATCFVDHHRPGGVSGSDTLISAYSWDPIPNTSLLIYDLFSPLVDLCDLDWISAIGTLSDLGERAPFELLAQARKKYTAKYLKEATTLLNAVRRASNPDPEAAARALLSHSDPRALVNSDSDDVAQLKEARREVKIEMELAKKAAPQFSGQVALIRLDSPCQIHPLIAQTWRARLPKYIVIAANSGYIPDRVNFSARAAKGTNVLQFLRDIELSPGEGNFGNGHDAASGGSLPPARWNELLEKLGFARDD